MSALDLSQNSNSTGNDYMPHNSMSSMMPQNMHINSSIGLVSPLMQMIQSVPAVGENLSSVLLQNVSMPVTPMNDSMNPSCTLFDNSGKFEIPILSVLFE